MEGRVPARRFSVFLVFCLFLAVEVVSQNGNSSVVNVGALFTFDSYIGRSLAPAIRAAVDDVNSDSTILKDKKINLVVQDTNCSGFIGTVEGISSLFLVWRYFCGTYAYRNCVYIYISLALSVTFVFMNYRYVNF